jgi:hypothetical protein
LVIYLHLHTRKTSFTFIGNSFGKFRDNKKVYALQQCILGSINITGSSGISVSQLLA